MKMDSKLLKIAVVVLIAIIIVTVCFFACSKDKSKKETEEVAVEDVIEEEKEIPIGGGFDEAKATECINSKCGVQIEKIFMETKDDGAGNQKMTYKEYVVSDISLDSGSCTTSDYTEALSGEGFDESKIKSVDFVDAFGFSYQNASKLSDLTEQTRKAFGFDKDLSDATFDSEKYELMNEESYVFNSDSGILSSLLGDESYDELLQFTSYYTLSKECDSKYPEMFTAVVQYKKDGIIHTKTAYLGFTFYGDETDMATEGGSCGCGGSKEPCPSCGGVDGCTDDCTGKCCN